MRTGTSLGWGPIILVGVPVLTRSKVSLVSLLPRFLAMLIAFNLLMIAIAGLFAYFADIAMPSGMAAIIPLIAAAQNAGQSYYRRTGELPSNGLSWSAGALFTAVNAVFNAVVIAVVVGLMVKLNGESLPLPSIPVGNEWMAVGIIGGILLFILLIQFVAVRFTFSSGAKQQSMKSPATQTT